MHVIFSSPESAQASVQGSQLFPLDLGLDKLMISLQHNFWNADPIPEVLRTPTIFYPYATYAIYVSHANYV